MTSTLIEPTTYLKSTCGFCRAGLHDRCPVAVWSPGSGRTIPTPGNLPDVHEGLALYCPCLDCDGKTPRCRQCGYQWGSLDELGRDLTCRNQTDCMLRIDARLETDPLHLLLEQVRTTRIVAGEVIERPRRSTPVEREKRKRERVEAKSRPCVCGCGGTTKGGAFLPGHDARYVANLVATVKLSADDPNRHADDVAQVVAESRAALAAYPKLLGKFEKRVAS